MADFEWRGDGPVFTIEAAGRTWTLGLDRAHPCLSWSDGPSMARLLGLDHVAAIGRRDDSAFSGSNLESFERYRGRIQATFAPSGWPGLRIRAAWGPTPDRDGFDLELQVWTAAAAVFRRLEIAIVTTWSDMAAGEPAFDARWVEPRDAHAAALSYDGRESSSTLHSLTTMPVPADAPHSLAPLTCPWTNVPANGGCYAEMVQPNDCARRIVGELIAENEPPEGALSIRYGLFGHDLEKGVVLRGRIRGIWIADPSPEGEAQRRYDAFLREPPALGP